MLLHALKKGNSTVTDENVHTEKRKEHSRPGCITTEENVQLVRHIRHSNSLNQAGCCVTTEENVQLVRHIRHSNSLNGRPCCVTTEENVQVVRHIRHKLPERPPWLYHH